MTIVDGFRLLVINECICHSSGKQRFNFCFVFAKWQQLIGAWKQSDEQSNRKLHRPLISVSFSSSITNAVEISENK